MADRRTLSAFQPLIREGPRIGVQRVRARARQSYRCLRRTCFGVGPSLVASLGDGTASAVARLRRLALREAASLVRWALCMTACYDPSPTERQGGRDGREHLATYLP